VETLEYCDFLKSGAFVKANVKVDKEGKFVVENIPS